MMAAGCKKAGDGSAGAGAGSGDAAPAASGGGGSHDASGPISEAALGVKIYPGAKIVTSGETAEVVSANLQTADAPEKVVEFYRKELGLPAEGPAATEVSGKKNNRLYVISVNRSEGVTSVSIMAKK